MSEPEPAGVLDVGLQAERTRLAWSRTALSLSVVAALSLHGGVFGDTPLTLLPGLLWLTAAVGCYLCGAWRYRRIRSAVSAGRGVIQPGLMRLVGVACVLPGLLVLVTFARW